MQKDFHHLEEVEEQVKAKLCDECKWSSKQGFWGKLFHREHTADCLNTKTCDNGFYPFPCRIERAEEFDGISECGSTGKLWEAK